MKAQQKSPPRETQGLHGLFVCLNASTLTQETCSQAKLHNVALYNSSKGKSVPARRGLKPAGCIMTLCKIAAHGVEQFLSLLTPFGQRQATGVRNFF